MYFIQFQTLFLNTVETSLRGHLLDNSGYRYNGLYEQAFCQDRRLCPLNRVVREYFELFWPSTKLPFN